MRGAYNGKFLRRFHTDNINNKGGIRAIFGKADRIFFSAK